MSSLEAELSEVKIQTHIVEQENLLLKDELEKMKQVRLHAAGSGCSGEASQYIVNLMVWRCQPPDILNTLSCQLAHCFVKAEGLQYKSTYKGSYP